MDGWMEFPLLLPVFKENKTHWPAFLPLRKGKEDHLGKHCKSDGCQAKSLKSTFLKLPCARNILQKHGRSFDSIFKLKT